MFRTPHRIDVAATEAVATPGSWADALQQEPSVQVLRLAPDGAGGMPGWCATAGQLDGPEIEVMCGGINTKQPDFAAVWRQGHLLHFGFEPRPGEYAEAGRALLLNCIAYIARFAADRPVVRQRSFLDPAGGGAPTWRLDHYIDRPDRLADLFAPPWSQEIAQLAPAERAAFAEERRSALCERGGKLAFDDDALQLGIDLRQVAVLEELAGMLDDGARGPAAERLLLRLLPGGPGAGTTRANWQSWLRARRDALCRDPHSHVFRIDALALARGESSAALRGAARADGDGARDAAAAALAAKVVAHHGGARALDDLATFTCAAGDVRFLWHRREGYFRMENRGAPGPRATPWTVAVFDTAADDDAILGGGPPPRPRVSAKGSYRELVERLFLPLLLLEPGTSLRRLEPMDGLERLEVRLAGAGLDPRRVCVLHVEAESGAVRRLDAARRPGARPRTTELLEWERVGPLLLPAQPYERCAWNPAAPAGGLTAAAPVLDG